MYAQSRFVTSVRGIGFAPTTSASESLGCTGAMNAAFGLRPVDLRAPLVFRALVFLAAVFVLLRAVLLRAVFLAMRLL
jgi:hypothetical protein